MDIIKKFKVEVKKYRAAADKRANKRLARTKTKVAREKVAGEIERERLATKREVEQAKTALLKAEAKRKKAAKEVRDIGGGDVFSGLASFFGPTKTRHRHRRKKPRKIVRRGDK